MSEHIETPATDDVAGHFLPVDDEGQVGVPTTRRPVLDDDDDDVAGHVLDLDIERKR
jgi:hypothetical protein